MYRGNSITGMTYLWSLVLLLGASTGACAEDCLDVETLPYFRTRQYPKGPYDHIVVYAPPRTGSSLVYNVLRYLFEDDRHLSAHHIDFDLNRTVIKTHDSRALNSTPSSNSLYVYTLRDPIAASISLYRLYITPILDVNSFARKVIQTHVYSLQTTEKMEAEGRKVCRLKFEDFSHDLDFIFTCIESEFNITIDEADKELMRSGYSKESIAYNTRELPSFRQFLPVSGFHGQHIQLKEFRPSANFMHWLNVYIEDAKPLFRKYGYFLD